jgi:hypothetical protein
LSAETLKKIGAFYVSREPIEMLVVGKVKQPAQPPTVRRRVFPAKKCRIFIRAAI